MSSGEDEYEEGSQLDEWDGGSAEEVEDGPTIAHINGELIPSTEDLTDNMADFVYDPHSPAPSDARSTLESLREFHARFCHVADLTFENSMDYSAVQDWLDAMHSLFAYQIELLRGVAKPRLRSMRATISTFYDAQINVKNTFLDKHQSARVVYRF